MGWLSCMYAAGWVRPRFRPVPCPRPRVGRYTCLNDGDAPEFACSWGVAVFWFAPGPALCSLGVGKSERFELMFPAVVESHVRHGCRAHGCSGSRLRVVEVLLGAYDACVLAGKTGRDAERKGMRAQQVHAALDALVGSLASPRVGGLLEALGADGGDEVLDLDHVLAELLVDERGVGEA